MKSWILGSVLLAACSSGTRKPRELVAPMPTPDAGWIQREPASMHGGLLKDVAEAPARDAGAIPRTTAATPAPTRRQQ